MGVSDDLPHPLKQGQCPYIRTYIYVCTCSRIFRYHVCWYVKLVHSFSTRISFSSFMWLYEGLNALHRKCGAQCTSQEVWSYGSTHVHHRANGHDSPWQADLGYRGSCDSCRITFLGFVATQTCVFSVIT